MKVVFACPSLAGPLAPLIESLTASAPSILGAGWETDFIQEVGNPYISAARATMLRKALDAGADVVVFLDYDLSWDPDDLLALIEAPGDVAAGFYRFKKDEEEYMGALDLTADGRAIPVPGGALAERAPAGFLKITRAGVERFMRAYPELCYGSPLNLSVDLFNHGAFEGVWWGEDYAFSRRWRACGGRIVVVPNLNLVHHDPRSGVAYPGNFHEFMCRQSGGVNDPAAAETPSTTEE